MSSEIRVNTLKNRVGLSTINFTDTGIVVSGISTFTNGLVINDTSPILDFIQTSGTNSSNRYRLRQSSGELFVQISTNNGASYSNAVSIGGIGNIFIPDNDKLFFGSDNDAYIQHDNSNLNVVNTTGNIDVTGHTNLGNVSIAGVTTMTGNLRIQNSNPEILLVDTGNNPDFKVENADGVFVIRDTSNSTDRLRITDDGKILIGRTSASHSSSTMEIQGSSEAYLRISPNTNTGTAGVVFGTADDHSTGGIYYNGSDDSLVLAGHNNEERLRISSIGNVAVGTLVDAGDNLRFFDVANYNTGANAGVVQRLLTTKSDGTSAAGLDIVKYKAGGAALINYETLGSNGYIQFSTNENGNAPTPRVTINGTGNLKINTAGKGIDFSANTNLAGMTEEVLDHYEVGTYVPTWTNAATPSYYRNGIDNGTSSNGLSYVRIGNQVTVTGAVFWQSATSINNVRPYMSLPFQARIYSVSGTIGNYSLGVPTEIHYLNYDSTTSINFFVQSSGGGHVAFGDNSNGEMYFNITYMTY